jgi:hypothetical protein
MPLPTFPPNCGFCHTSRAADCPRFVSDLVACTSGIPTHSAPATGVVEFVVDLSGARDHDHGDVEHRAILVCDHPACVAAAEHTAQLHGRHVATRHLTRGDAEDATGLDLAEAVPA